MSDHEERLQALEKWAGMFNDIDEQPVEPTEPPTGGHFDPNEFTCNHCGKLHPTNPTPPQQVLDWLEIIRTHFGDRPVNINSGYRCPTHNANVGGATSSFHMEGMAVDFWIKDVAPSLVYEYCDKLIGDKGGVGKYDTFTHIDCRGYKARW